MKLSIKLLLLLLLLFSISCTEEISKELKDSVADEANTDTGVSLADNKLRIINSSSDSLSHYLHVEGDATAPCEISPPATGWVADDYSRADDTDCILEVEEQDLYRNGAKFEIEIDAGLCEYITYEPMRFANYQPGKSTKVQYAFACDAVCGEIDPDFCTALEPRLFKSFSEDMNLHATQDPYYDEISQNQSCEFDYSVDGVGPNCDSGEVRTKQYELRAYADNWCEVNGVRDGSRESDNTMDMNYCTNVGTWMPDSDAYCDVAGRDLVTCTATGQWNFCSDGVSTNPTACSNSTLDGYDAGDHVWTTNACSIATRLTEIDCLLPGNVVAAIPGSCDIPARMTEDECVAVGTLRTLDCQRSTGNITLFRDSDADEVLECGGDALACFSGPGIDNIDNPKSSGGKIIQNGALEQVKIVMDFDAPYDKGLDSNKYIASYQRTCVNGDDKTAASYFSTAAFNGEAIEQRSRYMGFANLKDMPSTHTVYSGSFPTIGVDEDNNGVDDYIAYGVHPFLSIMGGTNPSLHSKQYYSVKCYDQAFDLKTQIRIHIRDWDRSFGTSNTLMNGVSDFDLSVPGDRVMDNNLDFDTDQPWNDRTDWDDFLVGSSLYSNDNCREIAEHPAKGVCMAWDGTGSDVTTDWVVYGTATNKEDCLAAAGTAIFQCSDQSSTDRTTCLGAGEVWQGTNWESDDNSSQNFPGTI